MRFCHMAASCLLT